MAERPEIFPTQWITVGTKKAVVSDVHEDSDADCTVVYLDGRNRPVYALAQWGERGWEFVKAGAAMKAVPSQNKGRDVVAILRAGLRAAPPSRNAPITPSKAIKPSPRR